MKRAEDGAALVLALVFVSAVAFIGIASLEMAGESFREDRAVQTARAALYDAGGALDTEVVAMRGDATWGRDGLPCAGLSLAMDDGALVQVTCAPVHASGAPIVGGLGARADRVVDLVASIGGVRSARERVEFVDAGGSQPGGVVRVRNWTVSP